MLQGGVASRPGQINTHIVSRALDTEIFNFGFSGNGVMELTVAQYLATIDTLFSLTAPWSNDTVSARTVPLVKFLRSNGHSTTPIVLAEEHPMAMTGLTQTMPPKMWLSTLHLLGLTQGGDQFLHCVSGVDLFVKSLLMLSMVPWTLRGWHHLTDLGMRKQAAYWATAIPKIKASQKHQVIEKPMMRSEGNKYKPCMS